MKKILLFIVMIIPMMIIAETVVPPGPVSGNWRASYSPYVVYGDIYIEEGDTLELEPGVELQFKGWYKLDVYGSLIAQGNESQKVIFTQSEGISIWLGISFMETSSTSILDHCIVQGCSSLFSGTISPENSGGGILCYNSPDASITISNSLIHNNRAMYGGGILCWNSSPLIENCEIMENSAHWGGGIELYNNANAVIKNTKFFNNHATYDGGGIYIINSLSCTVKNNQIAFNGAENGAGMHLVNSNGTFCANTIVTNTAGQDGGGIYFGTASSPDLINCLIYSNTDGTSNGGGQVFLGNLNCDPGFLHCNIYNGEMGFEGPGAGSNYTGEYEHCVDGDPIFNDAAAGDFTITWKNYPNDDDTKSACIDNGCPDQGPDPDQSCCDIGAYSYFQILTVPNGLYGDVTSPTTFIAHWSSSYGALGYLLDVSYHRDFSEFIIEGQRIWEETQFDVEVPYHSRWVFFRVRSFNTGLTSEYSNEHVVLFDPSSLDENEQDNVNIYASRNKLHITTENTISTPGEAWVYNTTGQLLTHSYIHGGMNTISLDVKTQIVIVKVQLEGKLYQEKLLMR